MNIGRIPPEGGGGGDIPLGAEKRRWHHDRASLMFSGYGVPPVRRSPRCAWGWSVAWDAGLPQDALVATQRRNGRAFSSLTARGGGLPVGVNGYVLAPLPVAPVNKADTVLLPHIPHPFSQLCSNFWQSLLTRGRTSYAGTISYALILCFHGTFPLITTLRQL